MKVVDIKVKISAIREQKKVNNNPKRVNIIKIQASVLNSAENFVKDKILFDNLIKKFFVLISICSNLKIEKKIYTLV